ncbi:hypothetical protein NQ314_019482 [Rhamnusium bicolor]|uniref:Uncharacterized protein n=1 Tax=Rhamnusium bicolor TaxID=1586634 RepID=A0AAV8WQL2_9CUCU|nr:hypothetical protein NQ314_019482 [Rhamnusium bicolor]
MKLFTCAAPARAYYKVIIGHTSKYACEKLCVVGKWQNHRIHFVHNGTIEYCRRCNKDFKLYTGNNPHIRGKSPLLKIGVNLIKQFPLDPMHLMHLAVTKRSLFRLYGGQT